MRFFPRTARRGLAAAATAGALALGALTVPSTPLALLADGLKDRERKVERQIDAAHDDLDESSAAFRRATIALRGATARLAAAQSRLTTVRAELTAAEVRDQAMAEALAEAVRRLGEARQAVEHGKRQVSHQREQIADTVVELYTQGNPDLMRLAALANAESAADVARQDKAREVLVGQEAFAYDDLRAAEVLLLVEEGKVAEARDAVARRREAAADHLAEMERLEAAAAEARAEVRSLVATRYAAQRRANQARARDLRVLRRLEREQDRVEEMLRRRAEAARRRAAAAARAAARAGRASRSLGSDGFLDYPVQGYVTSPFGYRTHPIYGYYSLHDGTDFGASCGSPLYAPAGGRVVDRYYSASYGNRLIIDHGVAGGKGVATILNHATHYLVDPGQGVRRGQLVGYVGSTGWSTGCHLHFTVMADGRAVNPMRWF